MKVDKTLVASVALHVLVIGSIVVAAGMATTLVGVGRAQGDTLCHPETGKTCGT